MKHPDPCTRRIWCRPSRYTAGGNTRKYIVVHNTANAASAVNEARNLANNAGQSSFHYAVDDNDIVQCVHDYDSAWAVGAWAGTTAYIRNSESISIEVCNPGTEFSTAEKQNLRALVLHLMEYYNIPASRVVRHWDCHSGRKACPRFYAGAGNAAWIALHAYITGQTGSVPSGGGSFSSGLGDLSWTGPKMLSEWQRQRGTDVDGFLSGQSSYNKEHVLERIEGGCVRVGKVGSALVISVQKLVGADPDGHMGSDTVTALQKWLKAKGLYRDRIDGHYGPNTSRGVGLALESKLFQK